MITELAELVGLLCHFRQEKGHRESLDHQEFIEWLAYHRHDELKNLIVNTAAVRTEIDNLLRSDHEHMLQKLDHIGKILISLMSRLSGLRGLTKALAPTAELSEQAILVLRGFVASGDDKFFCIGCPDGRFILQLGKGGKIEAPEPRFLRDDINQLTELQLITLDCDPQGQAVYRLTRNAVRFIEAVDGTPQADGVGKAIRTTFESDLHSLINRIETKKAPFENSDQRLYMELRDIQHDLTRLHSSFLQLFPT